MEVLKGNDTITDGKLPDVLCAFDGNDINNGNAGNDMLYGYAGKTRSSAGLARTA